MLVGATAAAARPRLRAVDQQEERERNKERRQRDRRRRSTSVVLTRQAGVIPPNNAILGQTPRFEDRRNGSSR